MSYFLLFYKNVLFNILFLLSKIHFYLQEYAFYQHWTCAQQIQAKHLLYLLLLFHDQMFLSTYLTNIKTVHSNFLDIIWISFLKLWYQKIYILYLNSFQGILILYQDHWFYFRIELFLIKINFAFLNMISSNRHRAYS